MLKNFPKFQNVSVVAKYSLASHMVQTLRAHLILNGMAIQCAMRVQEKIEFSVCRKGQG